MGCGQFPAGWKNSKSTSQISLVTYGWLKVAVEVPDVPENGCPLSSGEGDGSPHEVTAPSRVIEMGLGVVPDS